MMSRTLWLVLLVVIFGFSFHDAFAKNLECKENTYSTRSPDGQLKLTVCMDDGSPFYSLWRGNKKILDWSRMGFILKDEKPLNNDLRVESSKTVLFQNTWEQVWGEEHYIDNHYRELRLDLVETSKLPRKFSLVFRVFNDGLGFRYVFPDQPHLKRFTIMDELTEFNFPANYKAWWIPAFRDHRYEQLFQHTLLSQMPIVHTPLTMDGDGLFYSIHEAALLDFASMTLKPMGAGKLKSELTPWADGTKVKTGTPAQTPWRTIQVAKTAGDLITSYLILNLNEPNRLADTSWIKPQKFIGIWWGMHIGKYTWGSGPKHGATTERTKRYIDYAAELGIRGLLVEGWNVGWDGDWVLNGDLFQFSQPYPDFDFNYLAKYAREKGVNLIGHHETGAKTANYENQVDQAFRYYRQHDVRTVKTGYVGNLVNDKEWHYGQFMVRHYQLITEKALEYGIMLDIHEPIKDTGLRRTFPNLMSREGGRGSEWDAWDGAGGNPPEHTATLPFTLSLAGPFDFTPGIFDVLTSSNPGVTRVWTTLAKQLALYITIYSPVQMAADLPTNYLDHPMFKFIHDVPVDWETTKVLNGSIGDYVTIVRKERNGKDWFLGSITDENARELSINLSFLDAQRSYCAEIYRDGDDADYRDHPLSYVVEKKTVLQTSTLKLKLAAGGGQAIRFVADQVCDNLPRTK